MPDSIASRTAGYSQFIEICNAFQSGDLDSDSARPLFDELVSHLESHRVRFEELLSHCPDDFVGPFGRIHDGLEDLSEVVEVARETGPSEELLTRAWEAEQELRAGRDRVLKLHLETSGEDLSGSFGL